MSKASTLERVITDISRKDLEKAKDRVQGLLSKHANDLGLRHILGRMYLELGRPFPAGRYLYLVDDQSEIVQEAIQIFEEKYKDNPDLILKRLKLHGHISKFKRGYAKERLKLLMQRCGINDGKFLPAKYPSGPTTPLIIAFGCLILAAIAFVVGVIEIVKWIIHLIANLF